jgi:hypothetical protein
MADQPVLHPYQVSDRAEVFDFLNEVFPAELNQRVFAQWAWKYETSPFIPATGPTVSFIRIGPKIVGLTAAFRMRIWMGEIECMGETRGTWVVHHDYRHRDLWRHVNALDATDAPFLFGWTRRPARAYTKIKWFGDPVPPLMRVLDAGGLLARYTRSRHLARIGTGASTAALKLSRPLRRAGNGSVVRLESFDDRVDALCERARRPERAMVVRDRRYLNWRYCQRPDANYLLFGLERGAELAGFLVARVDQRDGMQWGYLVDFLAADDSHEVLS